VSIKSSKLKSSLSKIGSTKAKQRLQCPKARAKAKIVDNYTLDTTLKSFNGNYQKEETKKTHIHSLTE